MANKDEIRQIFREEFGRQPSSKSQSLYAATQDLIRGAASQQTKPKIDPPLTSSHATLPTSSNATPPISSHPPKSPWDRAPASSGKRKAQTGHPWRLKSIQSKQKKVITKSVNVILLEAPAEDLLMDYPFDESTVLLKGYVNLSSQDTSTEIKEKLAEVFRTKLSLLVRSDFDFIKRDRNQLSFPVTTDSWEWDYDSIKTLCGQGKLYCRLKEPSSHLVSLFADDEDDSIENQLPQVLPNGKKKFKSEESDVVDLTNVKNNSVGDGQVPCSSKNDSHVQYLQGLVNDLLDEQKIVKFKTLDDSLLKLRALFSSEKRRIKVVPTECLEEALIYYKDGDFDHNIKLSVTFKGQAAVDTGGVTRQFYTNVFDQMTTGCEEIPPMFEGKERRMLPVHNAGFLLSGLMEIVGKIMAHSIIQVGVGFAAMAPCIYKYIITGDISKTIDFVSIEDSSSPVINHYLKSIFESDMTDKKLSDIFAEEDFLQLYTESGIKQVLNMSNRDSVMQQIIFNDVVAKRVAVLNQLRSGLKLMGLLDIITANPSLYESLFVYKKDYLTFETLMLHLDFDASAKVEFPETHELFVNYLREMNLEKMEVFLVFATGAKLLPTKKIKVKYEEGLSGVGTSTCLLSIKIPVAIQDNDFTEIINAALIALPNGKSFTTV